ncbi:hypothetical protein T10_9694 [Trichinella papuae]|uniref:Uncharacterized protein n=1 Tax=Trichinella papuae TaxID=268474 RepID=A0A0V1M100_9BILA|nr:hypothetical protein T10_9694 [Trichinella papuae]
MIKQQDIGLQFSCNIAYSSSISDTLPREKRAIRYPEVIKPLFLYSKVIENKTKYPHFWHHSKVEHTKSVRYDAQVLMNIASYCVGSLFL